jgi:hypothetical protein
MRSITIQSHVGRDGILKLEIPVGVTNTALEVIVVVQPVTTPPSNGGWPPNFFEETYGSLADVPLERPEQGEYEVREELE